MKFLVYIAGSSRSRGAAVRIGGHRGSHTFHWLPDFQKHVYQGRLLSTEEFNILAPQILSVPDRFNAVCVQALASEEDAEAYHVKPPVEPQPDERDEQIVELKTEVERLQTQLRNVFAAQEKVRKSATTKAKE